MKRFLPVLMIGVLLVACSPRVRVEDRRLHACGPRQKPVGPKFCTHGDDTAEEVCIQKIIRVCYGSPVKPGPVNPPPPPGCIGDGVTGYRVQLFYAYTDTNDLNDQRATILSAAGEADRYLFAGAGKHYRWLCAGGQPTVTAIKVADYSLGAFINAALAAGYNSFDRVYTAMSNSGGGGTGTVEHDDSPGQQNANNTGPAYSITRGFSWWILMHELGHNLGAVQLSAPHSTGAWHAYDASDVMTYNDGGPYFQNGGQIENNCSSSENMWDCQDNDYSSPAPPSGNYLATHWNLRDSNFLG